MLIILLALAATLYWITTQMSTPQIPASGKLNPQQIAALAQNAGFTSNDLATAVAIALAESGGNSSAYNPETAAGAAQGKGSYGLWQIYLTAHPEYTAAQLLDPQTNANAAYSIYQAAGNDFTPWSTYNSGAYMNYAAQATAATGFEVA